MEIETLLGVAEIPNELCERYKGKTNFELLEIFIGQSKRFLDPVLVQLLQNKRIISAGVTVRDVKEMIKKVWHIASFSGGKDSLALLLKLIELKYPLNEIVYFNNGMDFDAISNIMNKVKLICNENKIIFTELKPECPFLYKMFDKPVKERKKKGATHCGYSWCGGNCRWGTTDKIRIIDNYCKRKNAICYVGIAADETKRLIKERKPYKRFPLADWGMTESDCLKYCYEKNYNWLEDGVELYSILDRVSCWCCRNKNLKELKNYYLYLPQYWEKLKHLQLKNKMPFYKGKSKSYPNGMTIFDLENRFKFEIGEKE